MSTNPSHVKIAVIDYFIISFMAQDLQSLSNRLEFLAATIPACLSTCNKMTPSILSFLKV